VLPRSTENLVHAIVFPDRLIRHRIPFEDAKGRAAHRDPQALLALPKCDLGMLALGDVESHTEYSVCSDGCMSAEPSLRSTWHPQTKLVQISLVVLLEPLLLGIALAQILEGDAHPQLVGANDECFFR